MADLRNPNRAWLDDARIDKGIEHAARAGTEMPSGLLSMTPLNSNPHGAVPPPKPPSGTRPTPPGAKISPNVAAGLPRQADGIAERVAEFLTRK
jgi:hypothetical protein